MQQQIASSVLNNLGPSLVRIPHQQLPILVRHPSLPSKLLVGGATTAARYSLRMLADQQFTPVVARELMGNVAHRLSVQTAACSQLLEKEEGSAFLRKQGLGMHSSTSASSSSSLLNQQQSVVLDNLRRLVYIHKDTLHQCRLVESNSLLFDRWSRADRHVVKATVEEVRCRHAAGLERWVDAVIAQDKYSVAEFEHAVSRILERRMGIHMLCDHLVKLSSNSTNGGGGDTSTTTTSRQHGNVSFECDLHDAIEEAYSEASSLCDARWQVYPELNVCGANLQATAILPWLHHALFEVMKNAMCASVRKAAREANVNEANSSSTALLSPPPITVQMYKHNLSNMIVIDVIDRGTGIALHSHDMELLLFGIGQSSARCRWDRLEEQQTYAAVRSPLCSLGVGLPISRMMMRHFGGDVQVSNNQDGKGGCLARILLPCDPHILEPQLTVKA